MGIHAVNRSRLALVLLFALGTASAGSLHGILSQDINRDANACTDFFDYANGAWRKQNPIPDYMDRWSRRWQSGEVNKEHVRDILTEVSAKHDWPQGSAAATVGRLLRRLHGRKPRRPARPCAGEAVARRGRRDQDRAPTCSAPSATCTTSASRCRSRWTRRRTCTTRPVSSPASTPAASACRTATTTSSPSKRFVEARAKYLEHVAKVFTLAGAKPDEAKAAATDRVRVREAPGPGLARQRRAARPEAAGPQDHVRRSCRRWRRRSTGPRTSMPRRLPHADAQRRRSRRSCSRSTPNSRTTPIDQWRTYLRWHVLHASADALPEPFVAGELRLLRQVPQRRDRDEAALEALRRGHRRRSSAMRSATPTSRNTSRPKPRRACRTW